MKKIALLLILLSAACMVRAQKWDLDEFSDDNEVKTVMNSITIRRISGFGGPTMSYSAINGEFAFLMGGGGGIIVNNFFLGGYGEGVSNSYSIGNENSLRNFEFGHGGFWLGYEIFPKKMIHPVISSRIGWGNISGLYVGDESTRTIIDNVFVLVPTVAVELNLTRFFKMNVGAEYRRTFNVNTIPNMTDDHFSSFGVYMNFLFGWF
ncbi:MAG TPA: hypothetical protein PLK12_05010 [Prolixibacteraceae bacterium]|nr:hypothetical protein [Prolixibacteraceae bacterium]